MPSISHLFYHRILFSDLSWREVYKTVPPSVHVLALVPSMHPPLSALVPARHSWSFTPEPTAHTPVVALVPATQLFVAVPPAVHDASSAVPPAIQGAPYDFALMSISEGFSYSILLIDTHPVSLQFPGIVWLYMGEVPRENDR